MMTEQDKNLSEELSESDLDGVVGGARRGHHKKDNDDMGRGNMGGNNFNQGNMGQNNNNNNFGQQNNGRNQGQDRD